MPSPDEVRRLLYAREGQVATLPAPAARNGRRPEPEPEQLLDIGVPEDATPSQPFPIHALPVYVADYALEVARAMQVEPESCILPALACLGAAIGNSRRIEVKRGWTESAAIWPVIVARPGSVKTATLMAASAPLREYERQLDSDNQRRRTEHEYELDQWEHAKGTKGYDRGPKPTLGPMNRQVIYDSTMEELAYIMRDNPRGLLLLQDEISGWVRGMNQYKSVGKGSDRSKWLSIWSNTELAIDRRNEHGNPVRIWNPFVTVCGGIQPDLLRELRPEKGQDDGFMDRLLFGWPPQRERLWTEATVSQITEDAYRFLFVELLGLQADREVLTDRESPRLLPLSEPAHAAWVELFNQHHREMASPDFDPRLHGAYIKLDIYAARLALIVHLTRVAGRDADDEAIDLTSMESAWAITRYFKAGARRVYGEMSLTDEDRRVEAATDWMRKHTTDMLSARDCTTYRIAGARTLSDVRSLFHALAERGYGTSAEEAGGHGGRKRLLFRLHQPQWQEAPSD